MGITPTPLFPMEPDDDTLCVSLMQKLMTIVMCTSATQDIKFYRESTGERKSENEG
jgi:hypothetical protein